MATDNIRFGRGRYRKLKKPVEDPIKEALRPSDAAPPQWMTDRSLLPKKPPGSARSRDANRLRSEGWEAEAQADGVQVAGTIRVSFSPPDKIRITETKPGRSAVR